MRQLVLQEYLRLVGNNVENIRKARKEKQETVCRKIGITQAVLSRIENGTYESLDLNLIVKLVNYFEVSLEQFLALEAKQIISFSQVNNPQTPNNTFNLHQQLAEGFQVAIDELKQQIHEIKIEKKEYRELYLKAVGKPE